MLGLEVEHWKIPLGVSILMPLTLNCSLGGVQLHQMTGEGNMSRRPFRNWIALSLSTFPAEFRTLIRRLKVKGLYCQFACSEARHWGYSATVIRS